MLQIRRNTFETNSSSTHSLILATEEQYDKLNRNELLVDWNGNLFDREKATKEILQDIFKYRDEEFRRNFAEYLTEKLHMPVEQMWPLTLDKITSLNNGEFSIFMKAVKSYADYTHLQLLEDWEEDEYLTCESESRYVDGKLIHAIYKYGYDG